MVEPLIHQSHINETQARKVRQLIRARAFTETQVRTFVSGYNTLTCGDAWYTRDVDGPTVIQRSPYNRAQDPVTGELQDREGRFLTGRPTNKSKFVYDTRPKGLTCDDIPQDKELPGDSRIMDPSWYSPAGKFRFTTHMSILAEI